MKKGFLLTAFLGLSFILGLSSCGTKGEKGDAPVITIGENGNWFIDGVDSNVKAKGEKGDTPVITIGQNGNWYINGTDSNVNAQGTKGDTPEITIGQNGNWYIDGADSNIKAQGDKGSDGISVESIEKTGTDGLVDTYTITFSNGTTTTFTITNGENGKNAIQYYPVTYRNEDGSFIDVEFVEEGKSATKAAPNVTNGEYTYTASWNVDLDKITGPTTATLNIDYSKLYFGTYPQTKLDETIDAAKISELNELAGDLPTSYDTKLWTDYNYIIQGNVSSYMYYQDIDYDNDGDYDYRGVYFTKYRLYCSTREYRDYLTHQNENGYDIDKTYWFSYDPIEWNFLEKENGKALIIANLLLDSQDYYPSGSTSSFSHNGGEGYANNYELSNIRKFLNDNFYNTAFNDLQKALIETTEVDNITNVSSVMKCNNTNDKIFLLSRDAAVVYYLEETGVTKGTDYAKCQGLEVDSSNGYSRWWLRTPSYGDFSSNEIVYSDGAFLSNLDYYTDSGVRPACWITL